MTPSHIPHGRHDSFAALMTGGSPVAGLIHILGFAIFMVFALI
ncbi:MAG: hypothetical protein AB7R89_28595 [Dehalococcoidia bacterium]